MSEVYKEISQEEIVNLPVETISEADVTLTREILSLFVDLFKAEHS